MRYALYCAVLNGQTTEKDIINLVASFCLPRSFVEEACGALTWAAALMGVTLGVWARDTDYTDKVSGTTRWMV